MQQSRAVELDSFASNHLCKVLRMGLGRELVLFDGSGGEYQGEIELADARCARVRLVSQRQGVKDSPLELCLALGLSRADRFDWALQKATELGVNSVQPLITVRSEKWSAARAEKKTGHWQRLMISAAEQSGRCSVPQLHAPLKLTDGQPMAADLRLMLQPGAQSLATIAGNEMPTSLVLVVGPEGGFENSELELLSSSGFVEAGVGPRVMRTETAPVAVISLAQFLWGDLN